MLKQFGSEIETGVEDVVDAVESGVEDVVDAVENVGDRVMSFEWMEVVKRIIKYLIMGVAICLVAFYLPMNKKRLSLKNVLMLGVSAAASFAVLDTFVPSVGLSARSGAGLAIGANIAGGFPIAKF